MLRRDRRPLPVQVRDAISQLIVEKHLGPGDQLPTESEISERFRVGRTTVREALKLLEQDGRIDVRHGLGRFVSPLPSLHRPITRLESVTEMMHALGYTVTNRLLLVREGTADVEQSTALSISPGEPVIMLERLRLQGEEPLIYSVDVLPRRLAGPSLEAVPWAGSLFEWLDSTGHRVGSATAKIRAVRLPRGVAKRIGISFQEPWLLMIHVNLSVTGEPLIFSHDYYRGDKFSFDVLRRREEDYPSRG